MLGNEEEIFAFEEKGGLGGLGNEYRI